MPIYWINFSRLLENCSLSLKSPWNLFVWSSTNLQWTHAPTHTEAVPDINSSLYFLSPRPTPILSVHADHLWLSGKGLSKSAHGLFTFSHKLCNDFALKNSIFISCPRCTRMVMVFMVNTTKVALRGTKFHRLN